MAASLCKLLLAARGGHHRFVMDNLGGAACSSRAALCLRCQSVRFSSGGSAHPPLQALAVAEARVLMRRSMKVFDAQIDEGYPSREIRFPCPIDIQPCPIGTVSRPRREEKGFFYGSTRCLNACVRVTVQSPHQGTALGDKLSAGGQIGRRVKHAALGPVTRTCKSGAAGELNLYAHTYAHTTPLSAQIAEWYVR